MRGIKMTKRKIPPTRFPDAVAVTYQRRLLKLVREMHRMTIREFDKAIKPQIQSYQADANELTAIQKLLELIRSITLNTFDDDTTEEIADDFVEGINQFNKKNMNDQAQVANVNPIDYEDWIEDYVKSRVKQNVKYIKSIPEKYHNSVETIVYEGVAKGTSIKEIREQIVKQFHVSESKAQFLAVDQSGTIHGQLVARRHQNMGVKKFEWVTSNDERVRKTHQALGGKYFSYEQPPSEGLPGEPYRCRCTAYPIFE